MTERCLHCFVSGRVQGVFFRASTREEAERLGLSGWVRNLPDGRVEVLARGPAAAIGALRAWLAQGPPMAEVSALDCREEDADCSGIGAGFTVRY